MQHFYVKSYDSKPIIKGNGFDGLRLGDDREEAEEFISFINILIDKVTSNCCQREEKS